MYSNKKRRRFGIPPRWLKCPRIGQPILDMFVPFKTILDKNYESEIPPANRFDLEMFLKSPETQNIGCVIDLTNTKRFYNSEKLERTKTYVKIECEGHEGAPKDEQAELFIAVVTNFLDKNEDKLVGVHCTHGFNRTGYMIICYLVDACDMELSTAIHVFSQSRKPGIYKQDYLDALKKRYNIDDDIVAPDRPAWCNDGNDGEDELDESEIPEPFMTATGNLSDSDSDANFPKDTRKSSKMGPNGAKDSKNTRKRLQPGASRYRPPKEPKFMEGVSGVESVLDCIVIDEVHNKMRELMNSERFGFLGSQPVSMTMSNVSLIADRPYMVSWKADGTRYMMLVVDRDLIYMMDRDNSVYKVLNLTFPTSPVTVETIENSKSSNRDDSNTDETPPTTRPKLRTVQKHLTNCVLDGEMVIDDHKGVKFPRYLIYDMITLDSNYVGNLPFKNRMGLVDKFIIRPRNTYLDPKIKSRQSFGVRKKDFFPIEMTKSLWEVKFRQELSHEMDGLVFQPCDKLDIYEIGRCDSVLKWKPPHLNSIDFLLKCSYINEKDSLLMYVGFLHVTGQKDPIAKIERIKKELREKYDRKIVECTFKDGVWEIMRERTDKSVPNHITTAQSVGYSINQPIHIDCVYKAVDYKLKMML